MTRPTRFTYSYPQGTGIPGGDPTLPPGQPPVDCCDDEESLPDRALDLTVFTGVVGGDGTLVQWDTTTDAGGGSSLAYPGDTTAGNLLVCVIVDRGGTSQPSTPSGWTLGEHGGKTDDWGSTLYWMVAPGGPVTVSFNPPTNEVRIYVMEFAGGAAGVLDEVGLVAGGSTTTFTLPSVTVTGAALLVGNVSAGNGVPNTITYTDDPDFTEVAQGQVGGALDPESITSYRIVSAGTYDFAPTGNNASAYGGVLTAFDLGEGWVGNGPLATDGDDATYYEISGSNVIRIWLGAPFDIGRVRLFIGCENSGAKSYTLKGANAADFSDAVTVATIEWTATGSFTGDSVVESWASLDAYEFWELTGDDETRYLYSFELYESATSFSTPSLDDVLAVSGGEDIADALTGANAPDAGNVFATMDDLVTGGGSGGFDVTPPQSVPLPAWVKPTGSGVITADAQGRITVDSGATYKAFPGMTFLEGRLHLVYRDGTNHNSAGGTVKHRTSDDLGRTWSSASTLITATGSNDVRDPAIVALSSGRLLIAYDTRNPYNSDDILPYVIYSDDRGNSWSVPYAVPTSITGTEYAYTTSQPVEMPDGTILVPGTIADGADGDAVIWSSTDGGLTFPTETLVAHDASVDFLELQIRLLASGKLVALMRSESNEHAWRCFSTDNGATWSTPADVVSLTGRIDFVEFFPGALIAFGRDVAPNYAPRWAVSWDEGATWTALQQIDSGSTDEMEYSAPIVLAPGYVAVVYAIENSSTDADLYIRYYHDGYGIDPLGNITALTVSPSLALSSATPVVESGAGSAGVGTTASRADHVHPAAGSSGFHYEVLMDGSGTATPLENGSGSDWLYVLVAD